MRDKKQQNLIPVWIKSRIISSETNFFSKNFKNTSGSGQAKKDEDQIQQVRKEFKIRKTV